MSDLPSPERTSHPFWTYEMIRGIPRGFKTTLDRMGGLAELNKADQAVFTGNGTAFYASWMGSQFLGQLGLRFEAVQSFELERYHLLKKDSLIVAVSHSGITKSTLDAVRTAKQGERTFALGLTHFPERPIAKLCDVTLVIGDSPDKSRCHTKAYIDSAAGVAKCALKYAMTHRSDVEDLNRELEALYDTLNQVTKESESLAKRGVEMFPGVESVVFAAAGPNLVTAREAALKIKESCFLPSEGIELEEVIHGSWVSFGPSTLVVVIAPEGPSFARAEDLLKAVTRVGAKTVVVSDSNLSADCVIKVPRVREYLSPFLAIIPLYFFSYFLAVQRGNNPDYIHYVDPAYWDARKILFPPGTH
jgi:glucosamine--fructose-6-phosphate aminotransferase (isomerizing)